VLRDKISNYEKEIEVMREERRGEEGRSHPRRLLPEERARCQEVRRRRREGGGWK